MARALLVAFLALAALTGGFDVRLELVRPECCHAPDSCCPADHGADCCQKTLQVTVTGKRDDAARVPDLAASSAPVLDLALAPNTIDLSSTIEPGPIALETRLDAHPPPRPTLTTVLRL